MQWETNLKKYIHKNDIEVELRIGKIRRTGFDTNIGKAAYERILQNLLCYKHWTKFYKSTYSEVFYDGFRKNLDTNEVVCKSKLYANNKKLNNVYDIRFSINTEVPQNSDDVHSEETHRREKIRHSFYHSFFRIDITHITNLNSYELELEITDLNYAKKHSAIFIIKCLVDESLNLVSCTNL